MTLYDLLTGSDSLRDVSLLWIREAYLKESVRLGGRVADLIYKGSVIDISKSFVGPLRWAVEFSIFQNCWDGMLSVLTERDGILSGLHWVRLPSEPMGEYEDLKDHSPRALYSLELLRIVSGDSVLWEA